MPVEKLEVGAPPATIRVEQPEGPFTVGTHDPQDVHESTGLLEHNPGDETVTADWHDQTPSGQFEQPGPEVVVLEGYEKLAKVVTPAAGKKASGTSGAKGK